MMDAMVAQAMRLEETARSLRVPTLSLDRVTPPALSERLAALIPGAPLHIIERAGQMLPPETGRAPESEAGWWRASWSWARAGRSRVRRSRVDALPVDRSVLLSRGSVHNRAVVNGRPNDEAWLTRHHSAEPTKDSCGTQRHPASCPAAEAPTLGSPDPPLYETERSSTQACSQAQTRPSIRADHATNRAVGNRFRAFSDTRFGRSLSAGQLRWFRSGAGDHRYQICSRSRSI